MVTEQQTEATESTSPISQPVLETTRLKLRPFEQTDAPQVHVICSEREVAAFTRNMPHPYPEGAALVWIEALELAWNAGKAVVYAVVDRRSAELVGAVGLTVDEGNENAELGYWIAKPKWGLGYATEAAAVMVDFGFREMGLHRIHSHHMTKNPASGRVMQKIGMQYEGVLREHVKKWGVFEDVAIYGVLAADWPRIREAKPVAWKQISRE